MLKVIKMGVIYAYLYQIMALKEDPGTVEEKASVCAEKLSSFLHQLKKRCTKAEGLLISLLRHICFPM